ncbi:cell division protein FtsZ (plasmid) [Pontibacillus sp. ALD_SL1]|uniref:cell division protein FtsZ n=1 Tax=Pontibacillus sp. ALD_SL1 TaxID=2777185 RepID=UPI001A95854A|nr:cell division protein FtsZ [Pontibacillus sp. ALD_SL1]QST03068.1 cell division protein FtsZ [Pontibacillus sp. ALD_SL1]
MENGIQNARIKVIGVGGGGNNAINTMIERSVNNVEFLAMNTDHQALGLSRVKAENRLQLGEKVTGGLGAGANPEKGRKAAEESEDLIRKAIGDETDMVFIAAGMGGGSGTGAAPVIAQLAREMGILTVGVVTMPFGWEGDHRAELAKKGRKELLDQVDTLITIPNNRLSEYLKQQDKQPLFRQAFQEVDNVLFNAVVGIVEVIMQHGYVNLDFADVKTIMQSSKGSALMGIGTAQGGSDRAEKATLEAMHNPMLGYGIDGANGVILNVTGGPDFTYEDLDAASSLVKSTVSPTANMIVGTAVMEDEEWEGRVQVTIIATGFDEDVISQLNDPQSETILKRETKPSKEVSEPRAKELETLNDDLIDIPMFLRSRGIGK